MEKNKANIFIKETGVAFFIYQLTSTRTYLSNPGSGQLFHPSSFSIPWMKWKRGDDNPGRRAFSRKKRKAPAAEKKEPGVEGGRRGRDLWARVGPVGERRAALRDRTVGGARVPPPPHREAFGVALVWQNPESATLRFEGLKV